MRKLLGLAFASALQLLAFQAAASTILDLPQLAGRTQAEAASALGKPDRCDSTKHGPKCRWRDGALEVVFIDGKADWITVKGLSGKVRREALGQLGLPQPNPDFVTTGEMRWTQIPGFRQVQLFGTKDGVEYAYAKVRTP